MMFKLKEYSTDGYANFALQIQNPWEEERWEAKHCLLNIALFKHSWWFKIPQLFKPRERWIDLSDKDWATEGLDGRKGYTESIRKQYGFSANGEAIHVYYGIQPGSWSSRDPENSDHTKVFWVGWNYTDRVRYDFYDLDGNKVASANDNKNGSCNFNAIESARNMVPKIKFKFKDYDGEENTATCYIEEMEWRHGRGIFKWVRLFRKPIIRRRLDINFEKETGYEKGSWKGGTMGTSTDIAVGESPLEAFTRYGTSEDRFKYHGMRNRGFTNIEIVEVTE
jgi:hypothetical protein